MNKIHFLTIESDEFGFPKAFDHFLASKFPAFKRYSLEGGESSMAFYEGIFSSCTKGFTVL